MLELCVASSEMIWILSSEFGYYENHFIYMPVRRCYGCLWFWRVLLVCLFSAFWSWMILPKWLWDGFNNTLCHWHHPIFESKWCESICKYSRRSNIMSLIKCLPAQQNIFDEKKKLFKHHERIERKKKQLLLYFFPSFTI